MVVVQLVEQSLPTPEVCNSNAVIGKLFSLAWSVSTFCLKRTSVNATLDEEHFKANQQIDENGIHVEFELEVGKSFFAARAVQQKQVFVAPSPFFLMLIIFLREIFYKCNPNIW